MVLANAERDLVPSFRAGLRPDPILTVSEWADEHRMLSQRASAEPGKWRTERTPFLREIMDCLSTTSPIQRVVFMAGAQVGKTECGNNWLGYIIDATPGPSLCVMPTVDIAKRFSKQRLNPLIEECPRLRQRVRPPRERDSGNSLFSKEFPGGILMIGGANSGAGLRSMPIKNLFCDEVDAYPVDLDGEGDPVSLAERRTTTFSRRKVFLCSTPTIKDFSRIEAEYLASDQRRYFVPCPDCGHMQWLQFGNIRWQDDDPKTAAYCCESCGVLIPERHKTDMLAAGEWRATAPSDGLTAGFHLSSLYSPLGWKSWADIVGEFLKAKADAPMLKTWVNTVLGETFEDNYANKVGASALMERVELYEPRVVPDGGLAVTVGVDVQDNRLAVSVWAWGREEEGWLVDHQEIYGDPSRPELWRQLDEIILEPFPHASGGTLPADVVCIDSGGHFTAEVYQYARERRSKGVIPIKGAATRNKPVIGKPSKVDVNARGRVLKDGVELFLVGTDTVKVTLFGRLKHNEPGPGYLHFHTGCNEEYFAQLTSEKQQIRFVRGFAIREFVKKPSERNEALDTLVYAYAGLNRMYQLRDRRTIWDQLEKRLKAPVEKRRSPSLRSGGAQRSFVRNW
jgi:phage terminase large subunit GpA-like protein